MISKQTAKTLLISLPLTVLLVLGIQRTNHVLSGSTVPFVTSLSTISTHQLYIFLGGWIIISLMFKMFSLNKALREKHTQFDNVINNIIPICITNLDYEIIYANQSYWSIWGSVGYKTIKCYEHRPGEFCHTKHCALNQVKDGAQIYTCESQKRSEGQDRFYLVTATPYLDSNNKISGFILYFQDITERKELENEKEQLISQFSKSLDQRKLLSGCLPICASCKSIKDENGGWCQFEEYIPNHSEAQFSHGICPDCAKKLYPEVYQT